MSFSQQGNSCGAWCVTRYLSLTTDTSLTNETKFISKALNIYGKVKFTDTAVSDWVTGKYSDPWKIIDVLGGTAKLCIELNAQMTYNSDLQAMLTKLENLTSRNKRIIYSRDIKNLKNGYAIAVMKCLATGGLHFLLVHKNTDLRLYDPRSGTLNWTTHKTFGFIDTVITQPIIGAGSSPQQFKFLGVFIQI